MSSLTDVEKLYLEDLFDMSGGYVLDYTDAQFGEFFNQYKISIHDQKYQDIGTSKAKKMRSFWNKEGDDLVGRVLSDMVERYKTQCKLKKQNINDTVYEEVCNIIGRLSGRPKAVLTDEDFLAHEYTIPNIDKLPIEENLKPIIQTRLDEALTTLEVGAHLSVIFLCGSVLEAVLLGAAGKSSTRFNQANASPKDKLSGKVKQFHEWSLTQLIDVACEIGVLKPDIKKFSQGLRDFRNYIHPYQELASDFKPDKYTAKLCFKVLQAALASVAGER